MSERTILKIFIDLIMTVLYLLLMFADMGSFFHEAVGIGIGLLFIVHVLLNIKPLAGMLRIIRRGRAKAKTVFSLLLDLLLPVGMLTVILTGILISRVLFNSGLTSGWKTIFMVHNLTSYICLGILIFHLAVHAKYLLAVTKTMIREYSSACVKKTTGRVVAGMFVVCFVYVMAFTAYKNDSDALLPGSSYLPDGETKTEYLAGNDASNNDKQNDNNDSSYTGETPAGTTATETLNEFLGKLFCTGCHNHCPLSNPQCGKSSAQIEEATNQYYEIYTVN